MPRKPDPITRLVRACVLHPLDASDRRYVDCDDVRGENLIDQYVRGFRRAAPEDPETKLFTGHMGVGKTTELLRLKHRLENPDSEGERPFKVIFFDVSESLDLNDLDFPDLLVYMAGEIQNQLAEANLPGFDPVTTYLKRIWDELKGVLGANVEIKKGEVSTGFSKFAVELRSRPSSRTELRHALEAQSTNLLEAVNDLLVMAEIALHKEGFEGLVLIIDGLDKLVRRPLEDGKSNTFERLFIDRSEQLSSLRAHTVYTAPISLIYSPKSAKLEQTFGERNVPVPMIPLHPRDHGDVSPDSPGMKKMWEILEARAKSAKVKMAELFDEPSTGHYLCEMTGGHPRHLMMFIQSAADRLDELPITREAAEKAVSNYANSLLRAIPENLWPKIKKFGKVKHEIPKDEDHEQMLLLLYLFEYMNDSPWYEVNPVIRTLDRFTRK